MQTRRKVFISFYHEDELFKQRFEQLFGDVVISNSVQDGDIDPNLNTDYVRQIIREKYLRDSSVTVVLVGKETWQRKHVDWEISASIRRTEQSPRSGLLGILLPTYPDYNPQTRNYNQYTVPPRLYDNVKERSDGQAPFAKMYYWTEDSNLIKNIVDEAYQRKDRINPDNSRPQFGQNHSGSKWSD